MLLERKKWKECILMKEVMHARRESEFWGVKGILVVEVVSYEIGFVAAGLFSLVEHCDTDNTSRSLCGPHWKPTWIIERSPSIKQDFMSKRRSWKFFGKGLPFLAVGSATLLLAYKIQQIKFEFGPSSCTLADTEEIKQFLNNKGIGNQQKNIEAVYQELVKKDDDGWENIRGPRESEDNKEFLQLNIPETDPGVDSSGDFSEAPPPPPGFPNTSREAVRGSEQTPVISSPSDSDFPRASTNERVNIQIIADPTIDRQSFPSSSAPASQSQLTQPVLDPSSSSISSVEAAVPTQPFYFPAVPDFNQETPYTTGESSQSVTLNLLDPDISLAQALVAGTSCSHPADPESKEDLVDPAFYIKNER
ncbi:unnamed protein product [Litomosoides sigmodontis]|uniref:Cytochrome c oxidase assembly protein COX16 homolog, mitochondrial n=1 Tax=Litomosoides sigmodontis TaxID=42156 RepID=A0A3P6S6M2_LITSI|nr:unnamed protein product [Litomosoides sigmodontis]